MSGVFLNASRTVCKRYIITGEIFGSVAITIRLKPNQSCQKIHAILRELYDPSKVARIEKWVANEEPEDTARAEEKIRGPDKKIGTCFMLETIRTEDAISILEQLPHKSCKSKLEFINCFASIPKRLKLNFSDTASLGLCPLLHIEFLSCFQNRLRISGNHLLTATRWVTQQK